MHKKLARLLPKSLKNRLIAMFILFILLPFIILSVYNFSSVETVLQRKASDQDREQLLNLKQSLEDHSGILVKSWTMLDQDPALEDLLRNPEDYEILDRKKRIEGKMNGISNSFFLSSSQVYYTLLDLKGNAYTSYLPNEVIQYGRILQEPGFQTVLNTGERYLWVTNDSNDVKRDLSRSAQVASFYTILRGSGDKPFALLRASMDYEEWFEQATGAAEGLKETVFYALADGKGNMVLTSSGEHRLPPGALETALKTEKDRDGFSWRDENTSLLYTAAYIPALDWYVVKGTPLDDLFAEVNRIKTRYFTALAIFMLLFAGVTAALSSGVTRPLFRLQRKMEAVAESDLKVVLPETSSTEEVQSLTRSFNRMVQDIHALISRLKMEERQKQAVRFQVLLSQMNPHFLLNTLNTIKSIAMQRDQDDIHDICVSLGKLLESSLNLDVDLIHLKEELGLVNAYMQIQNSRFGNRFEAVYDLDPSLQYALVPKSSLQPLVENAIVHGFGHTAQSGNIRICAVPEGSRLIMEVEDDGIGLEAAAAKPKRRANSGVGLSNLRERLGLLYQERAKLTLEPIEKGTVARLELPLLMATPYRKEDPQ
jgi:two-component system, sensor histidine kinase YesM